MNDVILVVNAGSSSIKFSVFITDGHNLELHQSGQLEGLFTSPRFKAKDAHGKVVSEKSWGDGVSLGQEGALDHLRFYLREQYAASTLVAVGHRVGHGGLQYSQPVQVTAQVLANLEKLIPLAPLHQPHNLEPIRLLMERMPGVPQIAVFDTAFHRTNPPLARMYALPRALTDEGVQRYGFHGISYEYIASVLPDYDDKAQKTIVLHLGNGSSMCAISGGKSVTSTMGFSALEGLPMGTRCGSLDPGVIIYLLDQKKMDARGLETLLYKQSGLLGVSGISSDVRTLLTSDKPEARTAIDLFIYRIGRELGSLAAALGGLDTIVFTAGIGENAVPIRQRVCRDAAWLGVELDTNANARGGPCISTPQSRVSAWVIPTNEELMIARHTLRTLPREKASKPLAHPVHV